MIYQFVKITKYSFFKIDIKQSRVAEFQKPWEQKPEFDGSDLSSIDRFCSFVSTLLRTPLAWDGEGSSEQLFSSVGSEKPEPSEFVLQ